MNLLSIKDVIIFSQSFNNWQRGISFLAFLVGHIPREVVAVADEEAAEDTAIIFDVDCRLAIVCALTYTFLVLAPSHAFYAFFKRQYRYLST